MEISVVHGPNLNLLGVREPSLYGSKTLLEINTKLTQLAAAKGVLLHCFQSNQEGEIISYLHALPQQKIAFILFNPAAFTHTSIALRDALLAIKLPFIEVHLSNVYAREPFRHLSYFRDIAVGTIGGFGGYGYELALQAAIHYLRCHEVF